MLQAEITDQVKVKALEGMKKCEEILKQRGEDYNGFDIDDYMPFGDQSYMQMVHLKATRAMSIVKIGGGDAALQDSLLDLVNYALFYYGKIELRRLELNGEEDE